MNKIKVIKTDEEKLANAIKLVEGIRHPGANVPSSIAKVLLKEFKRLERENFHLKLLNHLLISALE